MPLLSIIIPAYNAELTISDCLHSVLSQIRPNYELIIINDGSSDNTLNTINYIVGCNGNSEIKIINQDNLGVSIARNKGIEIATGDYIMLLDSDDIVLPESLDIIENIIITKNPDVITFDYNYWYPKKKLKKISVPSYKANELISNKDNILNVFFADKKMYAWLKVFKKDIYNRIGKPIFPPNQLFEDVSTVTMLMSCCENLFYTPYVVIDYRQHENSIIANHSLKKCLDFSGSLLHTKEFIMKQGISELSKLYFDYLACYLYISTVKNSFLFSFKEGGYLRQQAKINFYNTLLTDIATILDAMKYGKLPLIKNSEKYNRYIIKSISNDYLFFLCRAVSSYIKKIRKFLKK